MAPDAAPPAPSWPPVDGRDISRLRTEARLAHLALQGLLAEEHDSDATDSGVLGALAAAGVDLESAVDNFGLALHRLGVAEQEPPDAA